MPHSVLVTDFAWPDLDIEREILASVGAELVVAATGEQAELLDLAPGVDAILTCWKPVTGDVLRAAGHCRTVARYGVGLDNIDVNAATELGIVVSNVPEFCTSEVADHTMALVLAHARHIARFAEATAAGEWDNKAFGPMRRLRGRVFGLVGYGHIARAVARRALAFGYDVVAYSPSRAGSAARDGVRFAPDLHALLEQADVVSLHLPLSPQTRHVIGKVELAAMKRGAVLVNTARGALVDQNALVDALRGGQLGGAALDVQDPEPPGEVSPFANIPTVLLTPHAAFDSVEAIAELQETAARNVAAVLAGGLPGTIVNPRVLETPVLRTSVPA